MLFIADATTKSKQPVFYIKLSLHLPRAVVHVRDTAHRPRQLRGHGRRHRDSAGGARLAVASLLLWAGAITAGRLMAYL